MTKEELQNAIKVMQAYIDGEKIEWTYINDDKVWYLINLPTWNWDKYKYRIKLESKYRPFASSEEYWNEMLKHQPFGWVKNQGLYRNIANVMSYSITFADNEARDVNYEQAFKNYTFTDGTPFGIKIE